MEIYQLLRDSDPAEMFAADLRQQVGGDLLFPPPPPPPPLSPLGPMLAGAGGAILSAGAAAITFVGLDLYAQRELSRPGRELDDIEARAGIPSTRR